MSSKRRRLARKYEKLQDSLSITEQLSIVRHAIARLKTQRDVTLDLIQKLRFALEVLRQDEVLEFVELAEDFCALFRF